MTNLKRLGAAVVLTLGLTFAAYADCPVPGIINGPPAPCSTAQIAPNEPTSDNSTAPGQIEGPPVAEAPSVELPTLAEIALNFLMMF